MNKKNIRIESLGVYLPEKKETTEHLVNTCRHKPMMDLQRITGIKERCVAENEYAVDLGANAAKRALGMSRYTAEDIDLIISCSISKHHSDGMITFEPSTSAMIKKAIGAKNAQTFDVVNACAGVFNGVLIMESLLRTGAIRRGLVVSGEHNRPLVESALQEIKHSFDKQMASLTLGDCGAALLLELGEDDSHGFHHIDMVTGAKHNHYCYSQPSAKGTGGILITKAAGLQQKGAEHFPTYLKNIVDRTGWSLDEIDVGIAHQVSARAIAHGIRAVNQHVGAKLADFFVTNVEKYGNTTTTSHWVALQEFMLNGHIQKDHKLLFVSGASGIVITHATYTMDDLADRYRAHHKEEN